jgi:PIN domain nuclease of toxin-antitoxin system
VSGALLDTHALVWLVDGDARLSAPARRAAEAAAAEGALWVAAISVWEIGMLVAKDRLALRQDVHEWMDAVLALPGLRLAPLSPAMALAATRLPGECHGDPADRMIAATARHLGVPLLTADRQLLAYAQAGHLAAVKAD